MKALRNANIKLQIKKCSFLKNEQIYLGYKISEKGIETDPNKTKAIKEIPQPKTIKQLQRFLGASNFYRRFIDKYAMIYKPLKNLLKKGVGFKWTPEADNAFKLIKEKLCNSPLLAYPNFKENFVLYTDASQVAIGSSLN